MPWFMANFAYGGISKETLVILSILESWMWILARSPNFLLSSSISHFPFLPISIIPNFHSFQFPFLPIPIPPNSSSSQFSQSSLNFLFSLPVVFWFPRASAKVSGVGVNVDIREAF